MTTAHDNLVAYKAKLPENHPLFPALVAIEQRMAAGWTLRHFAAPPPPSELEQALARVEQQGGGRFCDELRAGQLAFYGRSNGLAFVLTPPGLPDFTGAAASQPPWDEVSGPIGYEVFSLERIAEAKTALKLEDGAAPTDDGALSELYESDLEEGAKADAVAFRYASFLAVSRRKQTFDTGPLYNETPFTGSIVPATASFPGGYLGVDGDMQPFLRTGDDETPATTPFEQVVAEEITTALEAMDEAFAG
jgi:hypothetical protein